MSANLKIGSNNKEFTQAMKENANALKQMKSEFGVASTQAKLFGSETDQLKTKQQQLKSTLDIQNSTLKIQQQYSTKLTQDLTKLKTENVSLQQKIESTNKAYQKSVEETGKNSEESKNLKAELSKLKDEFKQSENAIASTEKKLDSNNIKLNDTKKAILETKNALEETEEKIKNFKLDNVIDNLDKVSEKSGAVGETLSTKLTAPIAAIGTAMGTAAYSTENDLSKIQASLGLTEQQTEEMKKVAKTIYSDGYGEGLGDCAKGLIDLQQNIKSTKNWTDETKTATLEQIMAINETFGTETDELTRMLGVMQNSGLSDDIEHSMDVVVRAFQLGGDSGKELLDTLTEYPPQFTKLGLSADEAVSYMVTGMNNGARSMDDMADGLKEFSIRAIDQSDSTRQAFKDLHLNVKDTEKALAGSEEEANEAFRKVLKGLANINDPIKQEQIGVSLFGTKWEDCGRAAMSSLADAEKGLDGVDGATNRVKDSLDNSVSKQFTQTFRDAKEALLPLGTELLKIATKILPPVSSALQDLTGWLSSLDQDTKDAILTFGGIAAVAGPGLLAFGKITKGVKDTVKAFKDMKEWIGKIPKALSSCGDGIKKFGGKVGDLTKKVGKLIGKFAELIGKLITTGAKAVWTAAKFVFLGLKTAALTVWTWLQTAAQAALNFAQSLSPTTWIIIGIVALIAIIVVLWNKCEWFRDLIMEFWRQIKESFSNFDEFLQGVFATDWSESFGVFGDIFNGFFANISNIWEAIKRIFSGIIDFIAGVFTGDWDRAWSGIGDIFGGIWDSLVSLAKWPLNSVISLVNAAISGINSISVDIPEWSPIGGGKHLGFNLSKIAYLENGGILTEPTMLNSNVMAGEKNRGARGQAEMVIPLDQHFQRIKNSMEEILNNNTQPIVIPVTIINQLDGKEIGKNVTTHVVKEIDRRQRNYNTGRGRLA